MSCRMLKALKTALFLICCLSLLPTPSGLVSSSVWAQGGVGVGRRPALGQDPALSFQSGGDRLSQYGPGP